MPLNGCCCCFIVIFAESLQALKAGLCWTAGSF